MRALLALATKVAPGRTPAGPSAFDQLSLPYTTEQLTGLADSFLRDFPVGEFPYLMEHVRQHGVLDGLERMADR